MMQKTLKMTETLANGYSSESTQQELSNEYQHDRVQMIFKNLCFFLLWTKVASALEGLTSVEYHSARWWPRDKRWLWYHCLLTVHRYSKYFSWGKMVLRKECENLVKFFFQLISVEYHSVRWPVDIIVFLPNYDSQNISLDGKMFLRKECENLVKFFFQ